MCLSIRVLLQGGLSGPSSTTDIHYGDDLANWNTCDLIARSLGVPTLREFDSLTSDDAIEYAECGVLDLESWREEWFSPAEALETVRALLDYLQRDPHGCKLLLKVEMTRYRDPHTGLVRDLQIIAQILTWAEEHAVLFHFVRA
jgi:hypothetical protein